MISNHSDGSLRNAIYSAASASLSIGPCPSLVNRPTTVNSGSQKGTPLKWKGIHTTSGHIPSSGMLSGLGGCIPRNGQPDVVCGTFPSRLRFFVQSGRCRNPSRYRAHSTPHPRCPGATGYTIWRSAQSVCDDDFGIRFYLLSTKNKWFTTRKSADLTCRNFDTFPRQKPFKKACEKARKRPSIEQYRLPCLRVVGVEILRLLP